MNQVRKISNRPNYNQQLALQNKRRRLQTQIDAFIAQATVFLGNIDSVPDSTIDGNWFHQDDEDDEPIMDVTSSSDLPVTESVFPETIALPLPVALITHARRDLFHYLFQCELRLRIGQANDALHMLRTAIAHKSFFYRARVRKNAPTSNYSRRLRSYGDGRTLQATIDQAAKIYSTCRSALKKLGASAEVLGCFKQLCEQDLVTSTAVVDPNAHGQSHAKLSWIWQTVSVNNDPTFLNECKSLHFLRIIFLTRNPVLRVNWLRAKCRRDRWAEEKILLKSEMVWTYNHFIYQKDSWKARGDGVSLGEKCYCLKESLTWQRLAHLAQKALAAMSTE